MNSTLNQRRHAALVRDRDGRIGGTFDRWAGVGWNASTHAKNAEQALAEQNRISAERRSIDAALGASGEDQRASAETN